MATRSSRRASSSSKSSDKKFDNNRKISLFPKTEGIEAIGEDKSAPFAKGMLELDGTTYNAAAWFALPTDIDPDLLADFVDLLLDITEACGNRPIIRVKIDDYTPKGEGKAKTSSRRKSSDTDEEEDF